MTRRKGFTILDFLATLAIVGLLGAVLLHARSLPPMMRELVQVEGAEAEAASEPTVEDMEEAAEDAADEHDIYDRVVALTENVGQLTVQISGVLNPRGITVRSDADMDMVQVHINGKMVYEQVGGEIRTYLGMGEWEHLLGEVERLAAADREEMFRSALEIRFGSLPGWGGED